MKFIVIVLLMVVFSSAQDLEELIEQALQRNPALKARGHQLSAAQNFVEPAGTLPDPVLSFGLLNLPVDAFVFDQEPMSGKQIAFTQAIPFPGKLGLKKEIADLKAQQYADVWQQTRLQIILQVKQLYFQIFKLDRAIEVTERNQTVLQNFTDIAQTRYSVGKGIQQDVLKAQVEYARIAERLIELREQRASFTAQLNALLNWPADRLLPVTPVREFTEVALSFDSLKNITLKQNPLLQAWQKKKEQSTLRLRLAQKAFFPDFSLTVAYTQRDVIANKSTGVDYFSAMVGFKIPLYFWKNQRKQVAARHWQVKETDEQLNNVTNQLLAALQDAFQKTQKKVEQLQLYQTTIIPQASQALNSAIVSYQNDQVDFLTLLNNLMVLFKHEEAYYRLIGDYYLQLAQIEYLTAKPIVN